MDPLEALIALLTAILGADHELTTTLAGIAPEEGAAAAVLAQVTPEQLDAVVAALVEAGQDEALSTDELLEVADTVDYLRAELTNRAEEAAADEAARAELLTRLQGAADGDDGDDEGTDGDEGDEGDEGDGDAAAGDAEGSADADAAAGAPVPVTAGAPPAARSPRIGRVAARGGAQRRQAAPPAAPELSIRLLRDCGAEFHAGQRFASIDDLTEPFAAAMLELGHTGGGKAAIARIEVTYPEDRQLRNDAETNSTRVREAIRAGREGVRRAAPGQRPAALTASGGLCAPLTPYYGLAQLGDDGRPVRAALPGFQADRGGITFMPPPSFAEGAYSGGVAVWTADNDENPTDPTTKPFLSLDCDEPVSITIEAITEGLEVGNFRARTWPEQVNNFLHGVALQHAKIAEQELLLGTVSGHGIFADSTDRVAPAQGLGAARDLLFSWELAAVGFRDRHRMGDNEVLDVYAPHWALGMIRSDLMQEMPGATAERLATTAAQLDDWLAVRNLRPVWFRDTQNFSTTSGDLNLWPNTVTWAMHAPGSFLFLDGGTLDLGVIRDSVLAETNDYRIFSETFEAVAPLGVEMIKSSQTVCVNGATAGSIDPDTLCSKHGS